jgi:hypothetical protein
MKNTKRIGSLVIVALLTISSITALACEQDKFIGYDQLPDLAGRYAKLYFCPLENKTVVDGYAQKVEFKHAFYEAAYPNLEVVELWLDGQPTGKTQYAAMADVKPVAKPVFWETKYPYNVYNKLFTSLEGGAYKPATTYVDGKLVELDAEFSGKSAKVEGTIVKKGFDKYVVENGVVKDYSIVYSNLAGKIGYGAPTDNLRSLVSDYYSIVNSDVVAFEKGQLTDAYKIFDNQIESYNWLNLVGPDYVTGGTKTVEPLSLIATGYVKPGTAVPANSNPNWYDEIVAMKGNAVSTEWVTIGYEKQYPYRYYQVLKIDGVLMDGRQVERVGDWDYIQVPTKEVLDPKAGTVAKVVTDKLEIPTGDSVAVNTLEKIQIFNEDYNLNKSVLPYIFRYTGGNATPTVTWIYSFTESEYPHAIVEEKLLNGVATGEIRYSGKHATGTPELVSKSNEVRKLKINIDPTNEKLLTLYKGYLGANNYNYFISGDEIVIEYTYENLYNGHDSYYSIEAALEKLKLDWEKANKK